MPLFGERLCGGALLGVLGSEPLSRKRGRSSRTRPRSSPEEGQGDYFDGDAWALGDALAPPPPLLGIGDATDGLLIVDGETDRVPNQFHCVKPKNRRISTSSARIAAATPAPAPPTESLVSTTSEPAGLQ